ncbi:helix-turn-helix domain-containing protein [Cedecea sp.]|jgi:DNA-binding transcriptional regulator YdaS (Cro superfamily)|uniref:transcriptional regulator n=1 Tax=Cedecea sp. TaxID=1970739 RepID=UPI002F41EF91
MNLKIFTEQRRGLATQLGKAIGVNASLISQWANGIRQIPAERCPEIEKATNGVVTCEELRPDVSWSYLRRSTGHKTNVA